MTEQRLRSIREKTIEAKGNAAGFLLDDSTEAKNLHQLTTGLCNLIIELCDEVERLNKIKQEEK